MTELIPLKIKIGLSDNGHAAYPVFKDVMQALSLPGDWAHYVDRFGGWHYDNLAGHQEHDPDFDSPIGMQWGMLLVPREFAEKAVELFPEVCEPLDEAACETFYDTRAHAHEPEFAEDLEELQKIAALEQLGEDVTDRKRRALDPDDPSPGRRRNKRKFWQGYKVQRGVEIDHEGVVFLAERRRLAAQARRDGDDADAGPAPRA